jgi:hypothetical protein
MRQSKTSLMRDIEDINRLIGVVCILSQVRTAAYEESDSAVVSDGQHFDKDFDVVVSCSMKDREAVGRRITAEVSGVRIEVLADNLIGVRRI